MANSKAISIRIPDELLEKIDRLAEEKYKSHKGTPNRSLVLLDAIVAYFDTLSDTETISLMSDSVSIVDFQDLQEEVSRLKDTVIQLDRRVSDSVVKVGEKLPEQNQLSIIAVSGSVEELTGQELAKKLGVNASDISTKKNHLAVDEFIEWTKNLPNNVDKVGWTHKPKDKGKGSIYYPVVKPLA
jgi:metal-responsive CopG/Arc/MetJ family transcriptional regulator